MRSITIALAMLCAATAGAEEPKGLKVHWWNLFRDVPVASENQMIEWGATGSSVDRQLGENCRIGQSGEDSCLLGITEGWFADFKDDYPIAYRTTLHFIDGRFYRCEIAVPESRFSAVEAVLAKSLGAPASSKRSTVQNRMGARFDQNVQIWHFETVDVYLAKRGSKVTEGLLSMTYKPLAEKVPEDTAEAPF